MAIEVVVGVGARSSATVADCLDAIARVLHPDWVVVEIATLAGKENVISPVAESLGVRWSKWPAAALADVEVPNPSAVTRGVVGTASVAEAAAVLGSGGGRLLVGKHRGPGVTVAVAGFAPERAECEREHR